jgi:hypothetical protein
LIIARTRETGSTKLARADFVFGFFMVAGPRPAAAQR